MNNNTQTHQAERQYANPPNPTGFSIRHIQTELKTIQDSKAPNPSDAYTDDRILVWCYIKLTEDVDPTLSPRELFLTYVNHTLPGGTAQRALENATPLPIAKVLIKGNHQTDGTPMMKNN